MPKTENSQKEKCGCRVRVERYGGGHRWYCPQCDSRKDYFGGLPVIYWTNSTPPKDGECPNLVEVKVGPKLFGRFM